MVFPFVAILQKEGVNLTLYIGESKALPHAHNHTI